MSLQDIRLLVEKQMKNRYRGCKISNRFNHDPEVFSSLIAAGYKIKQPRSRHEWNKKAQALPSAYKKYHKLHRSGWLIEPHSLLNKQQENHL